MYGTHTQANIWNGGIFIYLRACACVCVCVCVPVCERDAVCRDNAGKEIWLSVVAIRVVCMCVCVTPGG